MYLAVQQQQFRKKKVKYYYCINDQCPKSCNISKLNKLIPKNISLLKMSLLQLTAENQNTIDIKSQFGIHKKNLKIVLKTNYYNAIQEKKCYKTIE